MMFKSTFHAGIVDGSVTRTFRYWKRPQAKAGSIQLIHPIGHIEITHITTISPSSLKSADAKRAGFTSLPEMRRYLDEFDSEERSLYRVDFVYVGRREDKEPDRAAAKSAGELATIDKALDLRDRNSKAGPWTRDTLALVGRHPGMSSAEMAERLGRDQPALKQDMRKLKKLGMTISLETGYRLSPKGESWAKSRGIC